MELGEETSRKRIKANFPLIGPILTTVLLTSCAVKSIFFWSDQSLVKYIGITFLLFMAAFEALRNAFNKDYNEIVNDSFKLKAYALSFYTVTFVFAVAFGLFWQFLLYKIFSSGTY